MGLAGPSAVGGPRAGSLPVSACLFTACLQTGCDVVKVSLGRPGRCPAPCRSNSSRSENAQREMIQNHGNGTPSVDRSTPSPTMAGGARRPMLCLEEANKRLEPEDLISHCFDATVSDCDPRRKVHKAYCTARGIGLLAICAGRGRAISSELLILSSLLRRCLCVDSYRIPCRNLSGRTLSTGTWSLLTNTGWARGLTGTSLRPRIHALRPEVSGAGPRRLDGRSELKVAKLEAIFRLRNMEWGNLTFWDI